MTACNDFAYDFGDDCFVYDVVYNFDFLKGYFIFAFFASLIPLFEAVDYFTNLGRFGEGVYLFDVMTACNGWFDLDTFAGGCIPLAGVPNDITFSFSGKGLAHWPSLASGGGWFPNAQSMFNTISFCAPERAGCAFSVLSIPNARGEA